jgi:hypothetical protein
VKRLTFDELFNHIFDGKTDFLTADFEQWARSSRRYKTFAETYRDKIRKKHRVANSNEQLENLALELETARWLLHDSRFEVGYESLAATQQRNPDFTVTFRTNTRFNVEVTLLAQLSNDTVVGKLMSVICEKIKQMPPTFINLLVIGGRDIGSDSLIAATTALRTHLEQKDEPYFTRRGYLNATEFVRQYHRLSGIMLRHSENYLWVNPLAKHPIPNELINALRKLNHGSND